jgi:predicted nuclease with TOPRIM domain
MEIQALNNFQKDLAPLAEKTKSIKGQINKLNQELSGLWHDLEITQQQLKMKFLQGAMGLKDEYKINLPSGTTIDGRWIACQNIIKQTVWNLNIQLDPKQLEGLLTL